MGKASSSSRRPPKKRPRNPAAPGSPNVVAATVMSAPTSTKVKPARSNAPSVKVAVDAVAVVAVVVVVVAVVAAVVVVTVLPRRNKQNNNTGSSPRMARFVILFFSLSAGLKDKIYHLFLRSAVFFF